jgi:hypothetical protein
MKQMTFELAESAFKKLKRHHPELNSFVTLNELLEELEEEELEVFGSGFDTYITRIVASKAYEKSNVMIVKIRCEESYEELIYPSFQI